MAKQSVATKNTVEYLRRCAINRSLFAPATLKTAIDRLGFVQADPIKSPATAQDLTLRQRVKGYANGDLQRKYQKLDIEEDYLYAYGFLPREVWRLLHPRTPRALPPLEKKVLELVKKSGQVHPRELEEHLGNERVVNAWGGHSKATTRALDDLHYRGLLRIVRRDKGIRVYEATAPFSDVIPPMERSRQLIMILANIFAPTPQRSLQEVVARLRYAANGLGDTRKALKELLSDGSLSEFAIDDVTYISLPEADDGADVEPTVKFLAPFDPVVWDRRRFEHLWGWSYRFEAYTPIAKRVRGYYAMPLLYGADVIGWANASVVNATLNVEVGLVETKPKGKAFDRELLAEAERLSVFLGLSTDPKLAFAIRSLV